VRAWQEEEHEDEARVKRLKQRRFDRYTLLWELHRRPGEGGTDKVWVRGIDRIDGLAWIV
jgi:hypothetical protein